MTRGLPAFTTAMGFDWASAFGGAASGAGTGAEIGSFAGPEGTVIGGAIGGIGGALFGGLQQKNTPQFDDRYGQMMAPQIASELQSNVGAQAATATAGQLRANANNAYRSIANNPNLSGNASVLNGAYNSAQLGAQKGIVDANLGGAEMDLATRQRGISDSLAAQREQFSQFQGQQALNMTPSPLEQVGYNAMSGAAGALLGKGAQKLGYGDPSGLSGTISNIDKGSTGGGFNTPFPGYQPITDLGQMQALFPH